MTTEEAKKPMDAYLARYALRALFEPCVSYELVHVRTMWVFAFIFAATTSPP